MSRISGAVLGGLGVVAVLLAGCTSSSTATGSNSSSTGVAASSMPVSSVAPTGSPAAGTTTTVTSGSSEEVTATVTSTKSGATITVGPPKATKEPSPTPGDCPYLSADVVSDITGQHHGQTQLVAFTPEPMCVFYRSDGGPMGSVRIIHAASAAAAVAAVNQHVPVLDSQPASQPAGWIGGSLTTAGQMTQDSDAKSTYAVSKGNIAVVAEENESPSIKARTMAVCAIYGLKLETGPTPDYCSVS